MRGVCEADGCKSLASLRGRRNGVPYYKRISNIVACSACGFVPQNACQMDRDHVNGDHSDNRPDNIQILCANCHRLKTYTRREGYFGKRVKGRT
jgi:5-methylcytosine-specific restriction endonuclease McrA